MLIGIRVRTADDYEKRIEPYQGRSWPDAVLKFVVRDAYDAVAPPRAFTGRREAAWRNSLSGLSSAPSSRPTSMADYPSTEETPLTTPSRDFAPLFPLPNAESRQAMLARIRERTSTRSSSGSEIDRMHHHVFPVPLLISLVGTDDVTIKGEEKSYEDRMLLRSVIIIVMIQANKYLTTLLRAALRNSGLGYHNCTRTSSIYAK